MGIFGALSTAVAGLTAPIMLRECLDDVGALVSIGLFTACLWLWLGIAAGV